ncbi:MbnP family protein [Flavobacterium sp. GB2R13]|uniref:MbnP family protein n=1 Tax=Flavobacterium algoris TaxID=3398733 RepID=UPI003A8BC265
MKNLLNKAIAIIALSAVFTGCTTNDEVISGTGNLGVEFDNSFGSNDLILSTQANTTSNNEVLKINKIKYIISNIVLTKEDGTTFTYPKSESYFIVDEATVASRLLELTNVPAANYTKIKFGIGVDKAQWELGAAGQGNFLATAQAADMLWSWSAGYKFLAFEGTFTSPTMANSTSFMVHTGQTGTNYNYTEITLDLPTKAMVRTTITPEIHVVADVSKIIDGTNKIKLSDNNMGGMGAMIMGGTNLPLITANLNGMFTVAHVHND